ncbi:MAG: adenylosuccinate synthase, partial [Candidatus Cloacimonetes bacterium]|nr:adenylosuccinate synthase [Candidatus Cloacimonadota bacterium]
VIDPFSLLEEIKSLQDQGIDFTNRFLIDPRAGVVLPLHQILDTSEEDISAENKIGTTRRGIGPCYSDLIGRRGIRIGDLYDPTYLRERISRLYKFHDHPTTELNLLLDRLHTAAAQLKPFLQHIPYYLWNIRYKKILFEGAQGTLLDVIFGTYPYVTSSHTLVGGISIGTGFPVKGIKKIIGVYKSYFTRVGEGPFPTELHDQTGSLIREKGNEFGSTTGRPRRCGWFDAVAARYSAIINGVDEIALTLLDVLSGFQTIKICTSYLLAGESSTVFPANTRDLFHAEPQYLELPGWEEDISGLRNYNDLPRAARDYLETLEELLERKISMISVGPDREQIIFKP